MLALGLPIAVIGDSQQRVKVRRIAAAHQFDEKCMARRSVCNFTLLV